MLLMFLGPMKANGKGDGAPKSGVRSGFAMGPATEFEGWDTLKQLTAISSLYAATFVLLGATALPAFLLDATASRTCLFAAFFLPVALGGFALLNAPSPMGSRGSCFQFVPGAAMLLVAMLAAMLMAASMLDWVGSMFGASGLETDIKGLWTAAFDATVVLATRPWVFTMLIAALSVGEGRG